MKSSALTLVTCRRIFEKHDPEMAQYIAGKTEEALNMSEVSDYARSLRDKSRNQSAERSHEKAGRLSKSYRLPKETVDRFAAACQERGRAQSGVLTELMEKYIDEEKT